MSGVPVFPRWRELERILHEVALLQDQDSGRHHLTTEEGKKQHRFTSGLKPRVMFERSQTLIQGYTPVDFDPLTSVSHERKIETPTRSNVFHAGELEFEVR
jgi:hypothetical protein